jgi:hypothetical protein
VDLIGGLWHVLNFFAAPAGVALFASLIAKLLWHRELQGAAWWRLWLWSGGAAALAAIGGLVWYGRDGKMSTYGAMVLACALALWWRGLRGGRHPG